MARMNGNVGVGIDRAGISCEDGETHQGIYDVALLSHIPNIVLMAPKDSNESYDMLYTSFNYNKPCFIRYSKNRITYNNYEPKLLDIGSWEEVKKGIDGTIISYGDFLEDSLEISKELFRHKLSIGVINARFIKPFDEKMFINLLEKSKPIFIYEEVIKIGSLGERLVSFANDNGYKTDIYTFAINDIYVMQGSKEQVLNKIGLDSKTITQKIRMILGG